MKLMRYISKLMSILACLHLWSCDVHEFPYPVEDTETSFVLRLDYDTEMPLHKLIELTSEARSEGDISYDIRYVVVVHQESTGEELYRLVYTKDDVTELNHSVTLKLENGHYKFVVWTDYVIEGGDDDYFYDTKNFDNLTLKGKEHPGNTDVRDAFRGMVVTEVSKNVTEAVVRMERPLAKFNLIATDLDSFISQIARGELGNEPSGPVALDELKVLFRYNGFMPNVYNVHTDEPLTSAMGVVFESQLNIINDSEVELGFDYVFIGHEESSVYVSVEIYDQEDKLLSRSASIEVPLMRSKLTTVKGKLLTSKFSEGAVIMPDYNGDHNVNIE